MRRMLTAIVVMAVLAGSCATARPALAKDLGMHVVSPAAGARIAGSSFTVGGTFDVRQSGSFRLLVTVGSLPTKTYEFSVSGAPTWSIVVRSDDFPGMAPGVNYATTVQGVTAGPVIPPAQTDPRLFQWLPSGQIAIVLVLHVESPIMTVNGERRSLDAAPIIVSGRTLVPLRAITEALGASLEWNAATSAVTLHWRGHAIVMVIGASTALVDGTSMRLDMPPRLLNSRTMVPVRFVTENLGCSVTWDAQTRCVTVTSD
ncbi:MAG TPA: copper amine oxidase N-terminal domain-containing protein [Candidatus Cryosericum sp.]